MVAQLIRQISRNTGLDRVTVRKYLRMTEEEFSDFLALQKQRNRKIQQLQNAALDMNKQLLELNKLLDTLKKNYADASFYPKTHNSPQPVDPVTVLNEAIRQTIEPVMVPVYSCRVV